MDLGSRWEIDYSQATSNEAFEWGRQDMAVRVVRALAEGRTVFFQAVEYRAATRDDVVLVSGQIEDAIVAGGYLVIVEYDDERGVSIGVHPEHRLH